MKPDMLNENSELSLTNSLYEYRIQSQDPWDVSDEKKNSAITKKQSRRQASVIITENDAATAFEKILYK